MKLFRFFPSVFLLLFLGAGLAVDAKAQKKPAAPAKPKPTAARPSAEEKPPAADDEVATKAELEAIFALPAPDRVAKLKTFIAAHPRSKYIGSATEALVRARAALGDAKLREQDFAGGIEQFKLAVADAPAKMSDDLYDNYVGQMPATLYVRQQAAAALELARAIEAKIDDNPLRLVKLALFYMSLEDGESAGRVAAQAVKLEPTSPDGYMALGSAQRVVLKLDDAVKSFAKAVELGAGLTTAQRSLADLKRATGHADEALPIYRSLLAAHADDEFARTGVVMSLLDTNQKDEAERELTAALADNPNNLALLVGVAYWYAAHDDGAHAVEYANRAVQLEPRFVWGLIALSRGLLAGNQPLAAERAIRFAKKYGNFPTLTYELASVLNAAGFYDEAAQALATTFTVKNGVIETRLAGRVLAQDESFLNLLAAERRASIFQSTSADTEANARSLKNLLILHSVLADPNANEADAIAAARAFSAGTDKMRGHRLLYAASRLNQANLAWAETYSMTEAATEAVEPALDVPDVTAAVLADELETDRARAIANDSSLNITPLDRQVLSRILRGRLEDLAGWSLFNQKKTNEAVVRLKRAVSVLPETTGWWRSAMWHLGAAQDAAGNGADALNTYYQIYRTAPDTSRRIIIEALYRRVNGSLNGLDDKIGPADAPDTPTGTEPVSLTPTPAAPPAPSNSSAAQTNAISAGAGGDGGVRPAPDVSGDAGVKPAPEATPAITMTLPRDMPASTPPASEPGAGATAPSNTPAQPEPTPESSTPAPTETKPTTTEPTPEPTPVPTPAPLAQPVVETPASVPDASKPTPDGTAKTISLPLPTEGSVDRPPTTGNPSSEPGRPRVAPSDAATTAEAAASPADVYRALFTAVHGSDADAIEHLLSQATIDYAAEQSRTEQKTLAQVIANGLTFTTTAREMPELGEERLGESTAILKVRNYAQDRWEELPFVKENGRWKLGIGDMNRGGFRAPSAEPAATEPAAQTSPASTEGPGAATKLSALDGGCIVTVSDTEFSLLNNGGSVTVTVTLAGSTEIEKITAATPNWSDIAVFPQSGLRSDLTGRVFTITSISKNTGAFTVNFKTPCGVKEVKVTVR